MNIHEIILASVAGSLPIDAEKLAPVQSKVDEYLQQASSTLTKLEASGHRLSIASYRHQVALFQDLSQVIAERIEEAITLNANRKQFQL